MKLLILGGTLFVGRHLTEAALSRGHEVTLFNRGRLGADLYPGVEKLRGDRDGDLEALRGRRWDAVIDTSGYVPRLVRASAALLADAVGLYVFISSVSVYEDFSRPVDEDSPLATLADGGVEEVNGETYGPLKVLCERAAEEEMPGRVLVIRPGLIVGPHDPTVRFPYWTARVARGGEVLAPGNPDAQVQLIDARDLAGWAVRMAEGGRAGVFNASGPDYVLTMRRLLGECRAAAGSDAVFTWVDEQFLLERGVGAWGEMPLWIPESDESHKYFLRVSVERAIAHGLAFRPLAETARDTLAWQRERAGQPLPAKPGVPQPDVSMKPDRERQLLDEWRESSSQ
jgi:2'-hydroxyisoflavone reductase